MVWNLAVSDLDPKDLGTARPTQTRLRSLAPELKWSRVQFSIIVKTPVAQTFFARDIFDSVRFFTAVVADKWTGKREREQEKRSISSIYSCVTLMICVNVHTMRSNCCTAIGEAIGGYSFVPASRHFVAPWNIEEPLLCAKLEFERITLAGI